MGKDVKVISRRYCDEPMARSKGYIGRCNRDCRRCFCCIEVDINGETEHVDLASRMKRKEKSGDEYYVGDVVKKGK